MYKKKKTFQEIIPHSPGLKRIKHLPLVQVPESKIELRALHFYVLSKGLFHVHLAQVTGSCKSLYKIKASHFQSVLMKLDCILIYIMHNVTILYTMT